MKIETIGLLARLSVALTAAGFKAIALTICLASACMASDSAEDGLTVALAAKPKVSIVVHVDDELSSYLTESQVKTDVELLLRQSNIPTVNENATGGLFVSVRSAAFTLRENSIYAVYAEAYYIEHVLPIAAVVNCVLKDTTVEVGCLETHTLFVPLWHKDSVSIMGVNHLGEIRGRLKDFVQAFALSYLRASQPLPAGKDRLQ